MLLTHKDEDNIASTSQPQQNENPPSEADDFENEDGNSETVIHAQNSDQITKKRICLKNFITIIRFLALQDMAYSIDLFGEQTAEQRHQEAFLSMVELISSWNDEFSQALSGNDSYLSKCASFPFQKHILHILASGVKKHIREEIGDSKFCIVLDGARDESEKEQMPLILRFVDKNGFIQEQLFDIVDVGYSRFNAVTLKEQVCAILSRHNLDVSNIRGQGYDGTCDMREQWNGLQALFLNECPSAYYIHCFAHKLDLALVGASTEIMPIAQFFYSLTIVVNFFCTCRKPDDKLLAAELNEIAQLLETRELETGEGEDCLGTMQQVGDARSTSYFSPICSLINRYDATCCILEKLSENGSNYCQNGDAYMAYNHLTTFDFVLVLHLMRNTMGITDILCQALQQQYPNVVNVKHIVRSSKALLQNMRQDGWDKLLKTVTSFCDKNGVDVPQFNAPYVPISRHARRQQENQITLMQYYREQVFLIAIDTQIQELNSRFSDRSMELLTLGSALVPKDTYQAFNIDNICTLVEKYYPMDFNEQEKITLRFQLQHFIVDARQDSNLKSLSTIQELCACLAATKKSEVYYLIDRLLRLIMTLPVSTPTTERSSSSMKTFKSMLKNMTEYELIPDSMIIYIERKIAKSFSLDSIIDDLESLNECNDSQLCSSVNGGIERPSGNYLFFYFEL